MTSGIFLLVITAAICHALWNFVARKVAGDLVVIWLSLCAGCLLLVPGVMYVIYHQKGGTVIPLAAVPYMIATGIIHALYFGLLARAYECGEISVVYPVARGSGIGLTALLAWVLLKENISVTGLMGIGCVFSGVIAMGMPVLARGKTGKGYGRALWVGLSITAYSLVDKIGVTTVSPVLYIWFMFFIAAVVMVPFIMGRNGADIISTARTTIGPVLIIGGGSIGTYLMILFALTVAPVSYIVAAREIAVVIGAALGIIFLNERLTREKILAVVVITTGLMLIKVG
jgi:drug/metabolite transporter (DMT)-like permease